MPELVTLVRMGETIPEWLIAAEPETPDANRGHAFRFTEDVQVIDTPNFYVVLPNLAVPRQGRALIDNPGMTGCRIVAASKPVMVAIYGEVLYGAEATPQFREVERHMREHLAAHQQALASGARLIPDPHRTFWQRLLYVLRGR